MFCRFCYKPILVAVLIVFTILGSESPAQKQQSEVDNILFIYDATSSMRDLYKNQEQSKATLVRRAMLEINRDIPAGLGLESGIYVVVPYFNAYRETRSHEKKEFKSAIENLPLPERQVGPQTALAKGLSRLYPVLQGLSGNTALILFSDGGENKGGDPVAVLEELYRKFDFCLHFVSYAGSGVENNIIERMSKVENCSRVIGSEAVREQRARKDFVQNFLLGNPEESHSRDALDSRGKKSRKAEGQPVDKSGTPVQERINLDIRFGYGLARVEPEYQDELKQVAELLKDRPEMDIVVAGHTDSRGAKEYNKKLSQRRASSVKQCLVEYGVPAVRIATRAYGESNPVADNETSEGRRKNRRVEIVLPR